MLASNLTEICSIVPLGRGYFPHASRHFVPGYDHASLWDKYILPVEALIKLALIGFQPRVSHRRQDKVQVDAGSPGAGRARLRPNRGFPRRTRPRRRPPFKDSFESHDMRGHWHPQKEMRDPQIQHLASTCRLSWTDLTGSVPAAISRIF
jgi:hypothetical protein